MGNEKGGVDPGLPQLIFLLFFFINWQRKGRGGSWAPPIEFLIVVLSELAKKKEGPDPGLSQLIFLLFFCINWQGKGMGGSWALPIDFLNFFMGKEKGGADFLYLYSIVVISSQ